MKKLNLIKRLLSYSHEKRTPQRLRRYAVMLIMLLTLGVGQMWADWTVSKTIYFDFTAVPSGQVMYSSGARGVFTTVNGAGTVISFTFTGQSFDGNCMLFKTEYGGWAQQNWTDPGDNNCVKVNSDGVAWSWTTYGGGGGGGTLTEMTNDQVKAVLDNGKVMVYLGCGTADGWGGSTSKEMALQNGNSTTNVVKVTTTQGSSSAEPWFFWREVTTALAVGTSGTYYLSNNPSGWSGESITEALKAGAVYFMNESWGDKSGSYSSHVFYITSPSASIPSTARSVTEGNSITVTTTLTAGYRTLPKSAVGTTMNLKFFAKDSNDKFWVVGDNTSLSSSTSQNTTLSGVAELDPGTYTIYAALYDSRGVYIKATNTFTLTVNVQTYTLTYDGNGKDGGGAAPSDASSPYNRNSTVTVKGNVNSMTKTGYHFAGWNTESDYSGTDYAPGATFNITANTILYAKWVKTIYVYDNLTWNSMKLYTWDSNNDNKEYNGAWSGESLSQIGTSKWYQVDILSGPDKLILNNGSAQTENITIASYSPSITDGHSYEIYDDNGTKKLREKKLTVSFNMKSHGGDAPSSQNKYYNELVTEPSPAPSETGYTFGGWYKETGCTNAWNFATDKVTADKTLFAKWTANQYSGTIDKNSGAADKSYTATYDATTLTIAVAPTRTGYTLNGYYEEAECTHKVANTSKALQASTSYTNSSSKWNYTSAPTLYAGWTANTWYVRFNGNGNTGGSMSNQEFTYDASATALTTCAFTRTGYTFAGWATSAGGSVVYDDKDAVSNLTSDENGIVDLYAVWTANKYTITLEDYSPDSWGTYLTGGCDTKVDNFVVEYNTKYFDCYLDERPTKVPYNFNGWYSGEGGAGDQIVSAYGALASGSTVYTNGEGKWNYAGDPTIYAKWTLTLSGYSEIKAPTGALYSAGTITFTYKSSSTSAFTAATRTGYTLDGYYTAEDGDKVVNADGTLVANVTGWTNSDGEWIYSESSTPSLYTKWTANTYTVAFDPGDLGSHVYPSAGSMASVSATYDEYVDMPANTFTREGYTFRGWSRTLGGDLYCMDKASYVKNLTSENGATATLYALWTGNTVTVSFNAREGERLEYCSSVDLHVGDTYGDGVCTSSDLPEPTPPSGYVFTGWYTAAAGGTQVTKTTVVTATSDHTLYARYSRASRVYFKNTLDWKNVYVTFDAMWDNTQGAGNEGRTYRTMSHIYGTDIWYHDIPASYLASWAYNIAFNDQYESEYHAFEMGNAIYRIDFDSRATMFVPTSNKNNNQDGNYKKNSDKVQYYSTGYTGDESNPKYTSGYWRMYDDTYSGYTLTYQKDGDASWVSGKKMNAAERGDNTFVYTITMDAKSKYYFSFYKDCQTTNTRSRQFRYLSEINSTNCTDLQLVCDHGGNAWMWTTVAGDYTFYLTMANDGHMYLTIDYPFAVNDYRVVYNWNDGSAHSHTSEIIKSEASSEKTISVFVHSASDASSRSLTIQKCTAIDGSGNPTWTDGNTISLSSIEESGVYNFVITQPASGDATGAYLEPYEGNYYIRTAAADGGWDLYKNRDDNVMTYSKYSTQQTLSDKYSHYYCKFIGNTSTDITYTVATDYSPAICPIMVGDDIIGTSSTKTLPAKANVRFTWNEKTNKTYRAYLKEAKGDNRSRFLVLHGDTKIFNDDATGTLVRPSDSLDLADDELIFIDRDDWLYEVKVKVQPGAQVSVLANYNGEDRTLVETSKILDGNGSSSKYEMTVNYDFKTNRLMSGWTPSGAITDAVSDVDVIIERHNQDGATTITFGKVGDADPGSLSAKRVIGALRFDYNELCGHVASWTPETRAKMMFFVSFPFDVNVSDLFGLNTNYGEGYIIQKYNGEKRAEIGFFAGDGTETFWETLPADATMEKYVGYVVTLDNDYFNGDIGHIWDNKSAGSSVYLYFPSTSDAIGAITADEKEITIPEHKCNIDRTFNGGKLNHKYTDSNWNVMGVPIFQNHTGDDGVAGTPGAIFKPSSMAEDTTEYINHPEWGYFYLWNPSKTYTITAADEYVFKPMHSYMVQYAGKVKFTCDVPTPASVAARRIKDTAKRKIEVQILNNDDNMLNRTYVELRENACDTFALNEDMYMMSTNTVASIYTFAGTYDVAANVLSIGNHIVPMGVIIKQAGTYKFTMPSQFSGTVTLIDTYTGTRTNLALSDYEVNLPKGTNDERFQLEININNAPTAIDGVEDGSGSLKDGNAHKFIMNDMMYILKDGVIYDARGARVK